jgi:hypothetical protein
MVQRDESEPKAPIFSDITTQIKGGTNIMVQRDE